MSNRMSAAIAVAALLGGLAPAALPTMAAAQQANGVTNCDAPGGRQRAGAAIGAVLGGVVGSNVARNERTLGTVADPDTLRLGSLLGALLRALPLLEIRTRNGPATPARPCSSC